MYLFQFELKLAQCRRDFPLGRLGSPGHLGLAVLCHGGAVPVLERLAARRHPRVQGPVAAQLREHGASDHCDSDS